MKHYIIIELDYKLIKDKKSIMRFTIGDYLLDDIELVGNKLYKLYEISDDLIKKCNGHFKINISGMYSNYTNGFVTKRSWHKLKKFFIIPEYIFKQHNKPKIDVLKYHISRMTSTKRKESVKNYLNHKNNTVDTSKFLKLYTGGYHLIQNQVLFCDFVQQTKNNFKTTYEKGFLYWHLRKEGKVVKGEMCQPEIASPGYYDLRCRKKYKIWGGCLDIKKGGATGLRFGYPDKFFNDDLAYDLDDNYLQYIHTKYSCHENTRGNI